MEPKLENTQWNWVDVNVFCPLYSSLLSKIIAISVAIIFFLIIYFFNVEKTANLSFKVDFTPGTFS